MNPADIHLKFPDEATAKSLLLDAGIWVEYQDEDQTYRSDGKGYLTDEIGLIYKQTGTMLTDDEGFEYPEMAPIEGWHINMRGDLPDELQQYVVVVNTPYRIWD